MATTRKPRKMGLGWIKGRGSAPRKLADAPPAPAPIEVTVKNWWANGWWGDQGDTSQCVIYSWLHTIHDGPVTHKGVPRPIENPTALYREAQQRDGTPITEVDSGLTCDSGAAILKKHGYIGEYRWAEKLIEVINYLLTAGPMVIGAPWYEAMFTPNAKGYVTLDGGVAGGHQWVMDGINAAMRRIRCKNSWSRAWGLNGFFYITFDQVEQLLDNGAEICVYRELPTPKVAA